MIDVSRVRAHPVFASRSLNDSRSALAAELVDHRLSWGRGTVDTQFSRVQLEHLSLSVLHYGAEVDVRPEPFKQFLLVQMPIRGSAEIESAGRRTRLSSASAVIASPNRELKLHWESGCEQLLIKVPLKSLCDVARSALALPDDVLQPDQVDFTAELRLDTQDGAAWRWMVEGLVNLVAMPGLAHRAQDAGLPHAQGGAGVASLNHAWRRHLEETAMLFLLSQQPNWLWSHGAGPAAQPLLPVPHEPASTHRDAIDRLEAYIAQRLCAPVSLFDLAKAAGLSVRSLHSLCRQRWNESPMTVLRHRRLDAARRRLLQGEANVTEVALDHGFGHLGRFSSYYRDRFGELPSATARSV